MKQFLLFVLLSFLSFSSLYAHGQEYLIVITYAFWVISPLLYLIITFVFNWRLVKKYGRNPAIELHLWKLNLFTFGLLVLGAVISTILYVKHIISETEVAWLLFLIPAGIYGSIAFLTLKKSSPKG